MEIPHPYKGYILNHIQRDGLQFLSSTFEHWEDNFRKMPIVYIGIGKPQHKLTTNQRFVANLGVVLIGATISFFLDKANTSKNDWAVYEPDNDEDQDDYEEESSA